MRENSRSAKSQREEAEGRREKGEKFFVSRRVAKKGQWKASGVQIPFFDGKTGRNLFYIFVRMMYNDISFVDCGKTFFA